MARNGFVSARQRKFVMSKLKKEGFPRPIKIRKTKRFFRARIKEPSEFKKGSIRTIDPGKPGGTLIVIGRKKGKVTTSTQAVLIPKPIVFDGKRFKK